MEKFVRLVEQYPMEKKPWTTANGESKLLKSVELVFNDNIESFTCEARDELAEALAEQPLTKGRWFLVHARMNVREVTPEGKPKYRMNKITLLKVSEM